MTSGDRYEIEVWVIEKWFSRRIVKLFVGVAQIAEDGRVAPKRLVVFRDEEPQA